MEVRAEMPWQMNFYSAVKRFGQDLTQDLSMQIIKQRLTVADYRPFTVRLQLKTLLPCILLLTSAIKVQLR